MMALVTGITAVLNGELSILPGLGFNNVSVSTSGSDVVMMDVYDGTVIRRKAKTSEALSTLYTTPVKTSESRSTLYTTPVKTYPNPQILQRMGCKCRHPFSIHTVHASQHLFAALGILKFAYRKTAPVVLLLNVSSPVLHSLNVLSG